jgi:hypothetical protein
VYCHVDVYFRFLLKRGQHLYLHVVPKFKGGTDTNPGGNPIITDRESQFLREGGKSIQGGREAN